MGGVHANGMVVNDREVLSYRHNARIMYMMHVDERAELRQSWEMGRLKGGRIPHHSSRLNVLSIAYDRKDSPSSWVVLPEALRLAALPTSPHSSPQTRTFGGGREGFILILGEGGRRGRKDDGRIGSTL